MPFLKTCTTLLFLFGTLYLTYALNNYAQFIMVGLSFLIVFQVFLMRKRYYVNVYFSIIFYLFILFGVLSSLKNGDLQSAFGMAGLLIIYLAIGVVLPNFTQENTNKFIGKSILFTHIPIFLLSLLFTPIMVPYRGIIYNPNAFGNTAVTVFFVILAILLSYIDGSRAVINFKKTKTFLTLLSLLIVGLLVVMSGSRTSLISMIIVSIIGLIFYAIYLLKIRKLKNLIISTVGLVSTLFILINIIRLIVPQYLIQYVFLKFERKSDDLLDGRGYVWEETIKNASLLGEGRDAFTHLGLGAHNSYISILGQYGLTTLTLFLLLLISSLYFAIKYIIKENGDSYRYLPLLLICNFMVLSIGEGMLFKLSMLAAFACIGSVSVASKRNVVLNSELKRKEKPIKNFRVAQ